MRWRRNVLPLEGGIGMSWCKNALPLAAGGAAGQAMAARLDTAGKNGCDCDDGRPCGRAHKDEGGNMAKEKNIMKHLFKSALLTLAALIALAATAFANPYPATLDNGNLVLVDAGMGVGQYADRSSVRAEIYDPSDYQLSINIVPVSFSEDYWCEHGSYIGSPYTAGTPHSRRFLYNWYHKTISYQNGEHWVSWDVNRDYSHAGGEPLIPNAAEVAFVSAYNMRFFGNKTGYSPSLQRERRIIDASLYRALGI